MRRSGRTSLRSTRTGRWGARLAIVLAVSATEAGAGPVRGQPAPETRLVLVGGGVRPAQAMQRFVEWAGGPSARLLVVPWASIEPRESCSRIVEELERQRAGAAECAPAPELDANGKASPLEPSKSRGFLDALARATGVFFTGGDQARVMDVLADATLLEALKERFRSGVVFGGTSAGTAIMSATMITGEGDLTVIDAANVDVRPGLGLLEGVILDQHFVRRQRENRLFGLVLAHPAQTGVGIDEDTALLVRNGRQAEVVGAGIVVLVDAVGADRLAVTLRRPGQRFDLRRRPRG